MVIHIYTVLEVTVDGHFVVGQEFTVLDFVDEENPPILVVTLVRGELFGPGKNGEQDVSQGYWYKWEWVGGRPLRDTGADWRSIDCHSVEEKYMVLVTREG